MGQSSSAPVHPPSSGELIRRLNTIFTEKCFNPLELYHFEQNFEKFMTEDEEGVKYWSEKTFHAFLGFPDTAPGMAALNRVCAYLSTFPFPSHAPTLLTSETLLRLTCFMTGRYSKVLGMGKEKWTREMWRAVAGVDQANQTDKATTLTMNTSGDVDNDTNEVGNESAENSSTIPEVQLAVEHLNITEPSASIKNELAYHTLDLLNSVEAYNAVGIDNETMSRDTLRNFLELLLLAGQLESTKKYSEFSSELDSRSLENLQTRTECILASFNYDKNDAISYNVFDMTISQTLPHLFDALGQLFEHFVVSNESPVHKRKDSVTQNPSSSGAAATTTEVSGQTLFQPTPALEPLHSEGKILDQNTFSQLAFIFSGRKIFNRLSPLYLGHQQGYSMGSFENHVFKWQGPSMLLVSGTLLSPNTKQGGARIFLDDLPYRRLSSSVASDTSPTAPLSQFSGTAPSHDAQHVIYGAYVPFTWTTSSQPTSDNEEITLFQLSPLHDVFPALHNSQRFMYFNKPPSPYSGLGFGSNLSGFDSMSTSQHSYRDRRPSLTTYSAADIDYGFSSSSFSGPSSPSIARRSSLLTEDHLPLGPVSLHIDDALEFGVFTHLLASGGCFEPSKLGEAVRPGSVGGSWQDRFEIDCIEVWGLGEPSTTEK